MRSFEVDMKLSAFPLMGLCVALCALPARADDRDVTTALPVPPNIIWMLDNSGSMADFTCYDDAVTVTAQRCFKSSDVVATQEGLLPTVKICRSKFMDGRGYDPAKSYWFDPGINTTKADAAGLRYRWDNTKVWRADAAEAAADEDSAADYCNTFSNCWQKSRCLYSLKTYGYFAERPSGKSAPFDVCIGKGDPSNICGVAIENTTNVKSTDPARMLGNLIEFYPPKYATARKVLREVNGVVWNPATNTNVRDPATKQRIGLWGYNTQWGGKLQKDIGPTCALAYDQTELDKVRDAMVDQVDSMALPSYTPLGETVDDIGCYFAAGDPPRPCKGGDKADGGGFDLSVKTNFFKYNSGKVAPICKSCQRNFIIIVTDGFPSSDGKSAANGGQDSTAYSLMTIADGKHGEEVINGTLTTGNAILPMVTKYLFENDIDTSTKEVENIISYAVSFGLSDTSDPTKCFGTLERAALYGSGRCFPASDYDELKGALQNVLLAIDSRSRAFSSPAVQATRTQGESSVNLAVYKASPTIPLWRGSLFSFKLFDERTDGNFSGGTAAEDEIFVVDADDKSVNFDAEGNLLSRPYWDAALCLAGDLEGSKGPFNPEDPFSLDVSGCKRYADESSSRARKLYTKLNPLTAGAGDLFGVGAANAQALLLQPLIGTTGVLSTAKLIRYIRGADMLDAMQTGNVTTPADRNLSNFSQRDGWWKLGDINHSLPTAVAQPLEFYNALVYGQSGGAYDTYRLANKARKRMLLAGANDGILHAFDGGSAVSTNAKGLSTYNQGTGEELWGFVPPHLLPTYNNVLDCPNDASSPCSIHTPAAGTVYRYRLDGAPLVRDAYVPGGIGTLTSKGTKTNLQSAANAQYWKSIAVIGDRDGGKKYTAFDVTDPAAPKYLWEFPTNAVHLGTGSAQRAEPAGYSWGETFPHPAPIFPMRFKDTASSDPNAVFLRWVVALPGGYDRNQASGRGFYLLDAGTGELIWKMEYGMAGAGRMIYSFAASPIGVHHGADRALGPYVDTLVAVDTGGQIWRVDASAAGVLSPLAQWTATRIFSSMADNAVTASNKDGTLALNEYPYRPFFHIPVATVDEDNNLRVYLGSGDRDLLANPNTAHLHGVNLAAEIRSYVCGVGSTYNVDTHGNRIYGIRVNDLPGDPPRPWYEATLTDMTASPGTVKASPLPANNRGWYFKLAAGEKVNNPADILQGYVYTTTYKPTGCDTSNLGSGISCDAPTGLGRLYINDYLTAQPPTKFSFPGISGIVYSGVGLGAGAPTAPAVSVGMGQGRASAAMLISSSQNPTPVAVRAVAKSNLVERVLKLLLPKKVHESLRSYGSGH